MTARHAKRRRSERGFVTTEFVLSIAFLILPVSLLVLTLPVWAERQSMTRVSAREASRAYVVTADQNAAQEAVFEIADNQGVGRGNVTVTFDGNPREAGAIVRATVTTKVPALKIPLLNAQMAEFELTDSHAEVVDLYRSLPQ